MITHPRTTTRRSTRCSCLIRLTRRFWSAFLLPRRGWFHSLLLLVRALLGLFLSLRLDRGFLLLLLPLALTRGGVPASEQSSLLRLEVVYLLLHLPPLVQQRPDHVVLDLQQPRQRVAFLHRGGVQPSLALKVRRVHVRGLGQWATRESIARVVHSPVSSEELRGMSVWCGRNRIHFRRQRVDGVRVPRQLVHLPLDPHHLQRLRTLQPLERLARLALNLSLHHALDVRNLQHPRAKTTDLVLDVVALRQQGAVHGVVQRPPAVRRVRSHVLG
mmetsp:Transcript_2521/g.10206  ORF Transcript_2521/g.10206 Transcript_2521/m.10206 type:complete len:273 (+) Transcript_2521:1276-2094(+)